MTKKERDEIACVYNTLTLAEHDASKNRRPVGMAHDEVSDDWVLGYHAGVGHALDLLGNFMERH